MKTITMTITLNEKEAKQLDEVRRYLEAQAKADPLTLPRFQKQSLQDAAHTAFYQGLRELWDYVQKEQVAA